MTPDERKGALVGLLGRLRTNAGSRLPKRSGDEEEFVPKSVIAARAAAAESAAAEGEATRIAALDAAVADLKRPRFAPDDVPLDTDPPPTAVPGSTPATLEEVLQQAEQAELERIASETAELDRIEAEHAGVRAEGASESAPPTPRSQLADEAPSIEMGDSAELELDLLDPFDDITMTGAPDAIEALVLESEPPPPRPRAAAPPVRPPATPPARPPVAPPVPARVAARPPPPPSAPSAPSAPVPPAPPASLTRAIPMRASPTVESRAVAPSPASSLPGVPPPKPRPPSPSQPGEKVAPPPDPPPPAKPPAPAPRAVHPPPISRVEPISSVPPAMDLPFDEQTEERADLAAPAPADDVHSASAEATPPLRHGASIPHGAAPSPVRLASTDDDEVDEDDELSRTVNMPRRAVDPLAQTAQNPIPAAFERAALRAEGAHVPSTDVPPPAPLPTPSVPRPDLDERHGSNSAEEAAFEEPISSKQPLDLDREDGELEEALRIDDGDDADEAPQSGEVASQRQPSTGPHRDDVDLDGATPPSDQADAVANEAMALLEAEAIPSAPPATRPAVMGRRPVAVTSFLDVLDDALALGE